MYGICHLSSVPCRLEASDRSEMVTQLLFGDHFVILEKEKAWSRIRIVNDSYECWVDNKQYVLINQAEFEELNTASIQASNELVAVIATEKQVFIPIVLGSTLPFFSEKKCKVGKQNFFYEGDTITGELPNNKKGIVDMAMTYLNTPYLWGGKTPFGIDCSGLTQMVYKLNGFLIPRDASEQVLIGETLNFVEEAEPGDLAFFDNEEGAIVHVGIVLADNKIIHASGKVRIDGFDHQGIFNNEKSNYSHRLRILKRVV